MTYAKAFRCSWLSKESGVRFGALGGVVKAASGEGGVACTVRRVVTIFGSDVTPLYFECADLWQALRR